MINREKINKARQLLIDLALEEICSEKNFPDFCRHAYYVIAKLGLQLKSKEDELFEGEEWSNPRCKDYLIQKLTMFLIRHIK